MTLGHKIRAVRKSRGMGQEEVAFSASISQRMLRDIEHDQARFPSIWSVAGIAEALRMSLGDLLAGVDRVPVPPSKPKAVHAPQPAPTGASRRRLLTGEG